MNLPSLIRHSKRQQAAMKQAAWRRVNGNIRVVIKTSPTDWRAVRGSYLRPALKMEARG